MDVGGRAMQEQLAEGWGEGVIIDNLLFCLSPHPRLWLPASLYLPHPWGRGLLPEGEGIAPIIKVRRFMSSMSSETQFVLIIRAL